MLISSDLNIYNSFDQNFLKEKYIYECIYMRHLLV